MTLKLTLRTTPEVPLEADCLSPDRVAPLSVAEIERLRVHYGNRQLALAEFFTVSGRPGPILELHGDLARVKHIGSGMSRGEIRIEGNAGQHLGTGMSGGTIIVSGNAGDWAGPEMRGGRIVVQGDAGHLLGAAYRGSSVGMTGGEILVRGSALNETGHGMRAGLIAVGGNCGDFTGVNLLAGTIIVFGAMGIRAGAGMRRGSVIAMQPPELLPTFTFCCRYRPPFVPLYLRHLEQQGWPILREHVHAAYNRWCGDAVELNRGEILSPAT